MVDGIGREQKRGSFLWTRHSYGRTSLQITRADSRLADRWSGEIPLRKVNHPNYLERNAIYNERVGHYVEEIFQTEKPAPVGYISPKRYRPRMTKHIADPRVGILASPVPPTDAATAARFDTHDLGDYEHLLFSALAWSTSATYVLAGEMGSGKSATMTFMRDVLERKRKAACSATCHDCTPVVVFLSLDSGTRYTAPNTDVVARVREDIINALHGKLRELLITDDRIDTFLAFTASTNEQKFYRFSAFHTQITMLQLQQGLAWSNLSSIQKTDTLLNFVSQLGNPEVQLDALMAIASFIRRTVRQDNSCFVILLDNIDRHFEPSKQLAILMLVFGFQDTGIRVLLAMRHTSFEGLASNAAFSFSYIQHAGPEPLAVGLERLRHYMKNWDSWLDKSRLTTLERTSLHDRARAIVELLDGRSFYRSRIAALAGGSIRAGLTLLARLFLNNTIPFEQGEATHKQDWLRAILLADAEDQHLAADDRYVTNVFSDPKTATFTWGPIRIMQLVNAFAGARSARNAKTVCTLAQELLGGGADDEILSAVNHLLKDTRPLLWVDGAYSFSSYSEMLARNDIFYLTQAGRSYYRLLLRDSVYLQEAMFAITWPGRAAPRDVDCRSSFGRSRGSRALADILINEDFEQYARLMRMTGRAPQLPSFRVELISVVIAAALAQSAVESMRTGIRDVMSASDMLSECHSWSEVLRKAQQRVTDLGISAPRVLLTAMEHAAGGISVAEAAILGTRNAPSPASAN